MHVHECHTAVPRFKKEGVEFKELAVATKLDPLNGKTGEGEQAGGRKGGG
jgi:hypothetical protein